MNNIILISSFTRYPFIKSCTDLVCTIGIVLVVKVANAKPKVCKEGCYVNGNTKCSWTPYIKSISIWRV